MKRTPAVMINEQNVYSVGQLFAYYLFLNTSFSRNYVIFYYLLDHTPIRINIWLFKFKFSSKEPEMQISLTIIRN